MDYLNSLAARLYESFISPPLLSEESNDGLTSRDPSLDQIRGMVIGECLADALGFLVEGSSPQLCAEFVSTAIRPALSSGDFSLIEKSSVEHAVEALQFSDDSQMLRELVLSLIDTKGDFSPEDYGKKLACLVKESRVLGCGLATAKAAAKMNRGIPWKDAGNKQGDAGNGSVSRAGAIGAFFSSNRSLLGVNSVLQSAVTHQDTRCIAWSIVMAGAVATCLRYKSFSFTWFLGELTSLLDDTIPDVKDTIQKYFLKVDPTVYEKTVEELKQQLQEVRELLRFATPISEAVLLLGQDHNDGSVGVSGFVTSSMLWSLYAFLKHKDSYWDAVSFAIDGGGDTDSTGALTGCLAGAYLGMAHIEIGSSHRLSSSTSDAPSGHGKNFIVRIRDRGNGKDSDTQWDLDKLLNLCDLAWPLLEGRNAKALNSEDVATT